MQFTSIIALLCAITLSACASRKQKGALYGAGAGAAIGAAVDRDNPRRGAGIGAAVGAAVGSVIAERYDSGTSREQPRGRTRFPVAKRTDQRGYVWSPYPPHQPVDVRGFRSGEVAVDPTTEKPFIIP